MKTFTAFHNTLISRLAGLAMALLFLQTNLTATTWFVNDNAGGANNGTSWTNAFTDLQSALAAAASGDEIWVAAGTYKPTSGTDRTISFAMKAGVAIYGGFAGTETMLGDRNVAANVTTLSGDIGTANDNTDNSYHVVTSSGLTSTARLDGFTVTAGNANGSSPNNSGGGMYNTSSSTPVVANCTFSGNSAADGGGGMYNAAASSPAVTNCSFSGNSASSIGGGMYNVFSSPAVANCTFSGNSASSIGGGMYNVFSSPALTNCTFSGNSAADAGGMYNDSSSPALTNCSFSGNS
ncbi:MAG: right-handed parallel beta-helix repeat-containing protein, partial [Saprospiraceae bacterium]